jgi:hypothetical protein
MVRFFVSVPGMGCQIVYFLTKNANFGVFWKALNENFGVFHGLLVFVLPFWYIVLAFGSLMPFWYILLSFGSLIPFWYILLSFGIFIAILVFLCGHVGTFFQYWLIVPITLAVKVCLYVHAHEAQKKGLVDRNRNENVTFPRFHPTPLGGKN